MPHSCGGLESLRNVRFISKPEEDSFYVDPNSLPEFIRLILPDGGATVPVDSASYEKVMKQEEAICEALRPYNSDKLICPTILRNLRTLPQQTFIELREKFWSEYGNAIGPNWPSLCCSRYDSFSRLTEVLDKVEAFLPQLDCDPPFQEAAQKWISLMKESVTSRLKKIDMIAVTITDRGGSKREYALRNGSHHEPDPNYKRSTNEGKTLAALRQQYPEAYQTTVMPLRNFAQKFGVSLDNLPWLVTIDTVKSGSFGCSGTGITGY